MNIYIKLSDFNQAELLALLPLEHDLAVQIRTERKAAEDKAYRLTHEEVEKHIGVYLSEGKVIHLLPPDPKPGSLRKHHSRPRVGPKAPTLREKLKGVDRDTILAILREQLGALETRAQA